MEFVDVALSLLEQRCTSQSQSTISLLALHTFARPVQYRLKDDYMSARIFALQRSGVKIDLGTTVREYVGYRESYVQNKCEFSY